MQLKSEAFRPGGKIPARFTCDDADTPPPLAWPGAPRQSRSYAIVCRDPDAPSGVWYHWAIFDIPAALLGLAAGRSSAGATAREAINDFGKRGYGGPCPPHGHGTHHYHFTIYALDVESLDLPAGGGCRDAERAAAAHAIVTAELIGTYAR
jgi:Raf kinase inhibitor-like YbhB/YbcL family protein